MNERTPAITSRLPQVGTTIFSVMSALAAEHGAVNLGQGFPDFDCDPALIDAVHQAMRAGHNQYPPMPGIPALRQAVATKIEAITARRYCPDREITITAGATQAILTAILAIVHPGDEVIVLDPCYDSYVPNIELAGGKAVRVPLTPGSFRPDFGKIGAAITPPGLAQSLAQPLEQVVACARDCLQMAGLGDVLASRLWGPLGMDRTALVEPAAPELLVTGYDGTDGDFDVSHEDTVIEGDGNVFTNLTDLAQYEAASPLPR